MAKVLGAVKSVITNVNEAIVAPVKNEVVTGVGEAATSIISGPSKISPQQQEEISKRQQEAINRRFYLKKWVEQLTAQEHQIRLADKASKKQQQQAEAPEGDQATVKQFKITDKPILQVQSKRVPGIPGGNILQKQTAPERTRKAS